mmetsp:Transcript_9643/g.27645  ORF Transcript_9643/g.27645 Transcript_9643/m.27645 type:complete len:221 (-) Transcript_9643:89-751(-)
MGLRQRGRARAIRADRHASEASRRRAPTAAQSCVGNMAVTLGTQLANHRLNIEIGGRWVQLVLSSQQQQGHAWARGAQTVEHDVSGIQAAPQQEPQGQVGEAVAIFSEHVVAAPAKERAQGRNEIFPGTRCVADGNYLGLLRTPRMAHQTGLFANRDAGVRKPELRAVENDGGVICPRAGDPQERGNCEANFQPGHAAVLVILIVPSNGSPPSVAGDAGP